MIDTDEYGTPELIVGQRAELALNLVGIAGACYGAYHAGETGDPFPLFAACAALAMVVLFVTSEG